MSDRIAVLIPCYNEVLTIKDVVAGFRAELPEAQIYVYDNASDDGTAEAAAEAGAIVKFEPRRGKGNVVRSMFADIEADCYIMADGDNTYSPEKVKEMARLVLEEKVDMVIGDRLSSTYFQVNKRPFHNFGNKLTRWLINLLFRSNVSDIMTGFRAFSRKFVKGFPVLSKGFEIETEMTIHALDKNFIIREIPIEYRDRPEGSVSKLNTAHDGIRVIKTIASLFREYKPFVFYSIIALILACVAVIMFIPVLIEYFQTGLVPKFPTLIVSCFILIIAMLLWTNSIVLQVIIEKHKKLYELFLINVIK